MSRVVAIYRPAYRIGEQRVHLLQTQRRHRYGWWRTLCGRDTTDGPNSSGSFARVRVENARGSWCRSCLRIAGAVS